MNKINPLEAAILQKAFGFDDGDVKNMKIVHREMTGAGFFTRVSIPKRKVKQIHEWSGRLPSLQGIHASLKYGAGFIFWKEENGDLTIEGYTYEEPWPNSVDGWTLKIEKLSRNSD